MRNLILTALLCSTLAAQAGGFTDSDGSLTEYVNQTGTLNLNAADMFAACKVADLVTTKIAFNAGAVEGNSLLTSIVGTKFAAIAGFGLLSIYIVYQIHKHYGKKADIGIAIAAGLTCGVAGHNLIVN